MNRTTRRVLRAALAGILIALGIGFGAFNAWWVALVIGVPLVFTGLALTPRPSRISELDVWRRGTTKQAVPIEVSAITRSSLSADDLQPTLVTATVRPRNDTEYEARWITSMGKGHAQDLISAPFSTIPPDLLPRRSVREVPEFRDHPGVWAVVYPAITALVAGALVFGIPASTWHVDVDLTSVSLPGSGEPSSADKVAGLDERRHEVLAEVAKISPTASTNLLNINIDENGTSRAEVFDPTTGDAIRLSSSGGWSTSRSDTRLRKPDTFTAAEVAAVDLSAMFGTMEQQSRKSPEYRPEKKWNWVDLEIKRPERDQQVVITGGFGESIIASVDIEGRTDGTIAEFFDPADFATSFRLARPALAAAGLSEDAKVLERFEIRGIASNTPIIRAGQIQNSGGVLLEFTAPRRSGTITIAPGAFPQIREYPTSATSEGDFAFRDVSEAVFESVRAQAIRRGGVDAFDRDAVDIEMRTTSSILDYQLAILIEMADADGASGTYSPQGRFLRPQTY
ncbi:YgaP family membrane protein [Gordonia soli]|nr:DUF2892 domain-containing protein [Gordonia soli]